MADLPPQVLTGKYLAVYDAYGEPKAIQIPYGRSVLVWDGSDIRFCTGTNDDEIRLPFIDQQEGGSLAGVIAVTGAGGLRMFMRPDDVDEDVVLTNVGGALVWRTKSQLIGAFGGIPSGSGVLIRGTEDGAGAEMLSSKGLLYITEAGQPVSISNGSAAQILAMKDGIPQFIDPLSGSLSGSGSGASSAGLPSVTATNTDLKTVNVKVPKITLSAFDGGADITVNNINVSASIDASVGAGGFDAGAASPSKWIYGYIVSDGASLFSLVLSENGPAPSHTAIGSYTHYGFATLFRVDATTNIVPYRQLGRSFYTRVRNMSDLVSITTSLAAVPQTTALSTFVPPSVKTVSGIVGGSATSGTPLSTAMAIASDVNGLGYYQCGNGNTGGTWEGFQVNVYSFQNVPIVDPLSPALFWKAGSATNLRRISINGYTI